MAARGMAMATRVAGDKKGNGNSDKEGDGNQRQHHGQWPWRRGWRAFGGSNSGNGDGDRVKDMAAHTTTVERGMMVAMGHGLCVSFCVCGETMKNKVRPKKCDGALELLGSSYAKLEHTLHHLPVHIYGIFGGKKNSI